MKPLRCGVAGLGRGRLFVDIFDRLPGCEVVAVCDSNPKALAPYPHLSGWTDFGEFLEAGLDVVAVITPGPCHAEQSIRAMEAGAHVLCETPCVYSLAEARSVLSTARRTGRRYMLAEDYLWMGWVEGVKARVDAGDLGEIVYAEGDYTHDCRDIMLATPDGFIPYARRDEHPHAVKTWRATHLPPILYCSHTLAPLLHLMQDRVVSAVGVATGTHTAPDLGTIDLEAGLFRTEKGAVIRLTNGFTVACPFSLSYNLIGTAGSIKAANYGRFQARWYSDRAVPPMTGWEDLPTPADWTQRRDGAPHVEAMVREFLQCIADDAPSPLDACRSMEFVLPGILAHESAMHGGVKLDMPDLRREAGQ